ncbi:Hypothetical protein CINCED_3A004883 [Cinara cedri]|uniref:Uncharacterized protein n=1 Tax=Cinara cedri TaxID=506608 RepID=A0A5E4MWL7_9HEMI|nr:Hypothetical protein CINCED_3A004883 [Cinara cedri]
MRLGRVWIFAPGLRDGTAIRFSLRLPPPPPLRGRQQTCPAPFPSPSSPECTRTPGPGCGRDLPAVPRDVSSRNAYTGVSVDQGGWTGRGVAGEWTQDRLGGSAGDQEPRRRGVPIDRRGRRPRYRAADTHSHVTRIGPWSLTYTSDEATVRI